jgi:hypothetical protein
MKRIYHPYWLWEDFKAGFYDNCSGEKKDLFIQKSIEMFNSKRLTKENMFFIVDNWKYSCEHNLTNPSINQIAYIGQAACCNYSGCPSTVTMEVWNMLTPDVQKIADSIALEAIERWKQNNKIIQLCLNLD